MSEQTQAQNVQLTGKAHGHPWRWLPWAAFLTALVAAGVNTLVYFAAVGLGFIPRSVDVPTPYGVGPLTALAVITGSVVGALGGAAVFALILRFARRPLRLFVIVATLALLPSLRTPFTIPDAPLSMSLSLELLHILTYAITVGLLTTIAKRQGRLKSAPRQPSAPTP